MSIESSLSWAGRKGCLGSIPAIASMWLHYTYAFLCSPLSLWTGIWYLSGVWQCRGVQHFPSSLKTQQMVDRLKSKMTNKFIMCRSIEISQNVRLKGPSNWNLANILHDRQYLSTIWGFSWQVANGWRDKCTIKRLFCLYDSGMLALPSEEWWRLVVVWMTSRRLSLGRHVSTDATACHLPY